ncbi:hypothetical protein [Parabacteroides goldsteinii]|uniref:hypothetical protein n=1 Tax=Parabacteroides goldsteinii TaxID=328812 RepID=UPI0026110C40|nr:hypothetical protein [Parabacteroides goldsteinii]
MKWGVRRYQNGDGTLTVQGKKRYDRDVRDNLAKKKDSRIDTSNPDPKRWVKEDMERSKRTIDAGADLVREAKKLERESSPKSTKPKMDLSKMTDKEMREQINRELLEQQYNKLFGKEMQPNVSKGREYVRNTLEVVGDVLTVGSSALAIALAIKELKG